MKTLLNFIWLTLFLLPVKSIALDCQEYVLNIHPREGHITSNSWLLISEFGRGYEFVESLDDQYLLWFIGTNKDSVRLKVHWTKDQERNRSTRQAVVYPAKKLTPDMTYCLHVENLDTIGGIPPLRMGCYKVIEDTLHDKRDLQWKTKPGIVKKGYRYRYWGGRYVGFSLHANVPIHHPVKAEIIDMESHSKTTYFIAGPNKNGNYIVGGGACFHMVYMISGTLYKVRFGLIDPFYDRLTLWSEWVTFEGPEREF